MEVKRKLIFDVDTGSDDAMAVMLAKMSGKFDIVAMCSVNGNHAVEFTTENTLRLAEFLKLDCPIYRGCELPLVSTLLKYRRPGIPSYETYPMDCHGLYLDLPEAKNKKIEGISAAQFYVEYLRKAKEPVTVVAVGPLSNLGLAIRIDPDIVKNIEELCIMGGGYHDWNCDPGCAEWNIWIDPEAAEIVFKSGIKKITMMPLDATHQALVTQQEADDLLATNYPCAIAAADMIKRRIKGYNAGQPMAIPNSAPIHDALCIAYLLDESVITEFEDFYMSVSISPDATDGATFAADNAIERKKYTPNIHCSLGCDREKFVKMLFDAYTQDIK